MSVRPPAYAAIDCGASTGRVLTGVVDDGRVELTERHRFPNLPVRLHSGLHWDLVKLFTESLAALRGAGELRSIGIDTWAVDYGLLDGAHQLLGLPFHYRDGRSDALVGEAFSRVSRDEQYRVSGIQTLTFNTVFQLLAEDGAALGAASRMAMIPDLLALWLTGEATNERTNASTTGLLDARTGEWSTQLVRGLGLPEQLFGTLVEPGELIGRTLAIHHLASVPVRAVASHDTASAFAAAPIAGEHDAILSSGTWSLLGVELPAPVLSDAARDADLTNERGVDGTIRLLKNVMGLWLEQECARTWNADHAELFAAAAALDPRTESPVFDPDDPVFLAPGDMPGRIAEACVATGQAAPTGRAETVRSILVSLACKYRYVLDLLETTSGRQIHRIHVIGGGTQVRLLCQLTADLCGREVIAGPVEATAMGNILVQARADGQLGSLDEIRDVVRASSGATTYAPSALRDDADATYQRFLSVTGLTAPVAA